MICEVTENSDPARLGYSEFKKGAGAHIEPCEGAIGRESVHRETHVVHGVGNWIDRQGGRSDDRAILLDEGIEDRRRDIVCLEAEENAHQLPLFTPAIRFLVSAALARARFFTSATARLCCPVP